MTTNFEETLISVWRQTLVEARQSRSKAFTILSDPPADPNCGRSISGSKNRRCEGSSKIRIRIRAGHNWHARESKSCNS